MIRRWQQLSSDWAGISLCSCWWLKAGGDGFPGNIFLYFPRVRFLMCYVTIPTHFLLCQVIFGAMTSTAGNLLCPLSPTPACTLSTPRSTSTSSLAVTGSGTWSHLRMPSPCARITRRRNISWWEQWPEVSAEISYLLPLKIAQSGRDEKYPTELVRVRHSDGFATRQKLLKCGWC